MRAQTRAKREARGRLIGALLFIASGVVITAGVYWYWSASSAAKELDDVSMCPRDGAESLTVLLVDTTDALSAVQQKAITNNFERIIQAVPVYGAVELFVVAPVGGSLLQRVGSVVCNPGSAGSPLTSNPGRVQERWHDRFWGPLSKRIEGTLNGASAHESPILESLQSIAVSEFQQAAFARKPKRLVVASDMLQHTRGLSQYSILSSFGEIQSTAYVQGVMADWTGTQIELLYVTRPGTPQGRAHVTFWEDYFRAAGGVLVRVTRI